MKDDEKQKNKTSRPVKGGRKTLYRLLFLICACIFLFSSWKVAATLLEYRESAEIYRDIKELYYKSQEAGSTLPPEPALPESRGTPEPPAVKSFPPPAEASPSPPGTMAGPTPEAVYKDPRIPREAFDVLKKINPDITGWIKIPNTLIDYPVLQGKDNEYYLTHSVNREVIKNASLFMDCRNHAEKLDFNTIIYGHNMHDSTMFGYLPEYKHEEFMNKHPYIYFDTAYAAGIWEIFSVYVTDTGFDYRKTEFKKREDCQAFIDNIKSKSMYKKEMEVTPDSRILTLSTCTYEFKDARLVVHAKLLEK